MPYIFLVILSSVILLTFKATNLGIRLSDTNVYFYTAYQIAHGKTLYHDIFFTNLPLFPSISVLYYWLTGGNIQIYYLTSVIEIIVTSCLIFLIVKKTTGKELTAAMGSLLYLFSFIVLSTSDHQSGVFLGSLFATGGYLMFIRRRPVQSGVLFACALCTKLYFLPIVIAFIVDLLLKRKNELLKFSLGFGATIILILLPSFIYAGNDLIKDIMYSFTRSQGIPKLPEILFFIQHDLLLFCLLIFSLVNFKKNLLLGLVSVFSVIFALFYQDVYYLYLNITVPFLVINVAEIYLYIKRKQRFIYLFVTLIILCSVYNLFVYISSYSQLGKVQDIDKIVSTVKKEQPSYIYGENSIAPAVAYLARLPLLDSIIDTNPNIFRKGYLNAKHLTQNALTSKTIVITNGVAYPESGVVETAYSEIMNPDQIKKACKLVLSQPIVAEGLINRLNVFKCYNSSL